MKKRNLLIVSLLVLAMSVVFLGCPDGDPEPDPEPTPYDLATGYLKAMGYTETLTEPVGGTFDNYYVDNKTTPAKVAIAWKGCDAAKYTAYKAEWDAKPATSINNARFVYSSGVKGITSKLPEGLSGAIDFFDTVPNNDKTNDTNIDLDVAAGSIVLIIFKSL